MINLPQTALSADIKKVIEKFDCLVTDLTRIENGHKIYYEFIKMAEIYCCQSRFYSYVYDDYTYITKPNFNNLVNYTGSETFFAIYKTSIYYLSIKPLPKLCIECGKVNKSHIVII